MGMGIVSDEELEKELSKRNNIVWPESKLPGRKEGDKNVPESLRKLIGVTAVEEGNESASDLAKSLGISDSSVTAYKNGATSTASYNKSDPALRDHINKAKERIVKKARIKLSSALSHITPEKFEGAKLTEISGVARDMSAIIKNMEPQKDKEDDGKIKNVNVILYRPEPRQVSDYEVLRVED